MKIVKTCLLLVLSVRLSAQPFVLKGKLPSEFNGKAITLIIENLYANNKYSIKDSALVKNNQFSFSGVLKNPLENAYLYITDRKTNSNGSFNFLIRPGENVTGLTTSLASMGYENNLFKNVRVLNSQENNVHRILDSLYHYYLKSFGIKSMFNNSIHLGREDGHRLCVEQLDTLKHYPNLYSSLVEIYSISSESYMARDYEAPLQAYNALNDLVKESPLGKEFKERQNARLRSYYVANAGNTVPQFTVKTDKGEAFSNLKLKGKPYILAFSATWCIPCQQYQPTLLNIFHKYQSKGLQVVYFNLDDNTKLWKKHIKEKRLDWINVSEGTKMADSKLAKQFHAIAIPLYIVVDSKGMIIYNGNEVQDDNYSHLEYFVKQVTD